VITVLGVDGCRGGWVGALVAGTEVSWLMLPNARAITGAGFAAGADAVGVDIPIGLAGSGWRACDLAAKRLLGRAHSRVFLTPPRAALAAETYAEAAALTRAACGGGLSKQAWALAPRIRDLDEQLSPALADRVVEVHPELSYLRMTGHVLPSKRTAEGAAARIDALRTFVNIRTALIAAPATVGRDDVLDALAAAWSARRRALGEAESIPDPAPHDARGLPMRIVI
jgi:predicted RNase H-like nuclease